MHLVAFYLDLLNNLLLVHDTIFPFNNKSLRYSFNLRSYRCELVSVILLSVNTLLLDHLFVLVPVHKQLLKISFLHSRVIGTPLITEDCRLLVYLSVKIIAQLE